MLRRKASIFTLGLMGIACASSASASFLDTDFWCRTYGCVVVHDSTTYDIYDNWQFATNSCCVPFGSEMIDYYIRAGSPVVTGTRDLIGPGPGDGEGMMIEVVDGSGVFNVVDDGDGFLDASDSLGVFSLNSATDLRLAGSAQQYSHSFYISSRNTDFSVRAFAQIANATGDFGDTIGLGDIKLTPSLSRRGNDGGWDYGSRANAQNVTIVSGIDNLGDLTGGPTQIMDFGRDIRQSNGDIDEQTIRLDFLYEMPEYDLSLGTGSLDIDVEFAFHREP
jgi:hypothetical protein